MKFEDHLREFLDNSIDDAEARELAVAAVAGSLRQIKLGVADRLWQARQLGANEAKASASVLAAARLLKARYECARAEYDRLTGTQASAQMGRPDLQVIEGGRPGVSCTPGTPRGSA